MNTKNKDSKLKTTKIQLSNNNFICASYVGRFTLQFSSKLFRTSPYYSWSPLIESVKKRFQTFEFFNSSEPRVTYVTDEETHQLKTPGYYCIFGEHYNIHKVTSHYEFKLQPRILKILQTYNSSSEARYRLFPIQFTFNVYRIYFTQAELI